MLVTGVLVRLTPPGIAATAAGRPHGRRVQPPHAPRNRGDCGRRGLALPLSNAAPPHAPGIAATAATNNEAEFNPRPPHAPRNRGDCGARALVLAKRSMAASRPPESRRLRQEIRDVVNLMLRPPHPPGIAATAASGQPSTWAYWRPPHAPRNRGDCGSVGSIQAASLEGRLTPPGIAATAAGSSFWNNGLAGPPHAPGIAATAAKSGGVRARWKPPHAPRNRGDCGRPALSTMKAASRPPESRRLRRNGY